MIERYGTSIAELVRLGFHPYGPFGPCVYLRNNGDGTWYVGSTEDLRKRYLSSELKKIVLAVVIIEQHLPVGRGFKLLKFERQMSLFCIQEGFELSGKRVAGYFDSLESKFRP
jgi:hypothetical protein